VRAWIGVESGQGSMKGRLTKETERIVHGHIEVPDPIPASSKCWIEIEANGEERAKAVLDVFQTMLIRRKVDLKSLDAGEPRLSGKLWKITATLEHGISSENAKKIAKLIRDEGPKGVRTQIQGDELRVFSKKRDDLQAIQSLVKGTDYDFAVQFTNYR